MVILMNKMISFNGKFGLERETFRVTRTGKLAQTSHPFTQQEFSRDFCENQLEIITPVCNSIESAVHSLQTLSKKAQDTLALQNEKLWMCSNPPHFDDESEITIANYTGEQQGKHQYRLNLERRYGKKMMLFCGIHFNLSFDEETVGENKNAFYMKLLKYSTKYSWLLTLLTAASPVYDASFDGARERKSKLSHYASIRNSERGYWNQFIPILDYTDVQTYCDSIQRYIDKGVLFSEGELYLPVRIKPEGINSIKQLSETGVDHIELRMFDLNPLFPEGIALKDLQFARLLLLYFSLLDDFDFTEQQQREAIINQKNAAKFDVSNVSINGKNILQKAKELLLEMKDFLGNQEESSQIIDYQINKIVDGKRYAQLILDIQKDNFVETILSLA